MNLADILRGVAAVQKAEVKRQAGAAMRTLVLMLIAAVLALCALVFLMVGAYETLSETRPAWQAGGLVALGALAAALLVVGVSSLPGRRSRAARPGPATDSDPAAQLGAMAGDFLRDLHPSGTDMTIAAFIAGLLASRSTRKQRSERD